MEAALKQVKPGLEYWTKESLSKYEEGLLKHEGEGFDLRTHIVNPRTGELIRSQPYTRLVDRDKGTIYTRNGKKYSESGVCLDKPEVPAMQVNQKGR